MVTHAPNPRIALLSVRNVFKTALFRASLYEFEDVISQLDSVDLLAPRADPSTRRYNAAKRLTYHSPMAFKPSRDQVDLKTRYDVFLMICGAPTDLLMLNAVRNWRESCKTAICLIDELWITQLDDFRHFLRLLKDFDAVALYYSNTVKPLSERIGRPCVFVPPGVDSLLFCPYPRPPARVVDVCSIGRRSDVTHRSLLHMAAEEGTFYLHDSISGDQAIHLGEHRRLLSNIGKRSRYFIVNPGLIDRPAIRGSQIEIGNRYFEGSASGSILLGEHPNNAVFSGLFDWPDALIHLPYDSAGIDEIIHDLDKQPARQETIGRTNVANALLRHDWVYRWESILKMAKLEPMPQVSERKQRLRRLAEVVNRTGLTPPHLDLRDGGVALSK